MHYFATLGTFDGLHKGHQTIISTVKSIAREQGVKSALITFEPYPQAVVPNHKVANRLCSPKEKRNLLEMFGLDRIVIIPFTSEFAQFSPMQFIKMLIEKLPLIGITVGYNFCFGYKRSGNAVTLQNIGDQLGFDVRVIPPIVLHGSIVSSSQIKLLITRNKLTKARLLLGYPYGILGRVQQGQHKGRSLGFPTVNLAMPSNKILPPNGVYIGAVRYKSSIYKALINLGPAPTNKREQGLIEAYLLDFCSDIYDEEIQIVFFKYLRPIRKFHSLEKLKEQLEKDMEKSLNYYNKENYSEPWILNPPLKI